MELLLGYDKKVILTLVAGIFFLCFAVYCNKNKKKWIKDLYEKLWSGTKSQGIIDHENELKGNMPLDNEWVVRNRRDAEDIRSGMGLIVYFRYFDWICALLGVVALGLFWLEVSENPYKDMLMKWVIIGIVFLVCVIVGVVQYLRTNIGKETKTIPGKIIAVYKKNKQYDTYRIDVSWVDEEGRCRVYPCTYNFRKYNLPKIGESYELIYSYKYDNVKSKREIRQGRRYSFYGFGLAVFIIILVILNLRLY